MRNHFLIKHRNLGFFILVILLVSVSFLAVIIYGVKDLATVSPFLAFAVQYHVVIMMVLIVVSVAFGFFWSHALYSEIRSREKTSRKIMDVVLLFLGTEERKILNFLVEKDGKTTQAHIARIEGMNKVKAFRSVKKMQDKQIVDVVSHGKVRQVLLKENILDILLDSSK
ncbi:hypothetical protein GOV09_02940 [Candidatus Woesearchaeota archaeon]|nr:hypothetical protein [Candidatus Woesearchaeota archaeon]